MLCAGKDKKLLHDIFLIDDAFRLATPGQKRKAKYPVGEPLYVPGLLTRKPRWSNELFLLYNATSSFGSMASALSKYCIAPV
jgi:hypothetical protein